MPILEIPQKTWAIYLQLVGTYLARRTASIWLEEPDGRVCRLSMVRPFLKFNFQLRGARHNAIEIVLRGELQAHQVFCVNMPSRLWLCVADDAGIDGLLIEDQHERRTLLRFGSTVHQLDRRCKSRDRDHLTRQDLERAG
jgi:hypothetical protein